MKQLEQAILEQARVLPGNILKVDSIINHQIDPQLMMDMGKDIYEHFKEKPIDLVLTLEVSGIALAMSAAYFAKCPMVFAKKSVSLTLSEDIYQSAVFSHTKQKTFKVMVDKKFLQPGMNVLIIDDFLAKGEALGGLLSMVEQAKAKTVGVGIAIEKVFQEGGKKFREDGIDIYSLARIASLENGTIEFIENESI